MRSLCYLARARDGARAFSALATVVSVDPVNREDETSRGELFILSAPSGTGKTTLIHSLMEGELAKFVDVSFSVSHTTRQPRAGEVDGRDYHFVESEVFQQMIAEDRFLEWAEVHNHYYGTAFDEVLPQLERGIDVLMDIDVQGAERVLSLYPDRSIEPLSTAVHSIFIMPPSFEALEHRLQQRDLDNAGEIARRLAVSRWEVKRAEKYHYVIVNEDASVASYVLASIILEKRHRYERMRHRLASVMRDFSA